LPLRVDKTATQKNENLNENTKIIKEVELKNLLPFSSISLFDKNNDESEDETSESDEEEIHKSIDSFFGHFDQT
jgi:hypothetical protein